ncbi:MAG UNVERIFIED_CONTAM: hypothetical protein LOD86_00665 [Thermobifida fusca]
MGYELYRHVLNHAPAELDPTARAVLAVIADDANERTRISRIPMDLLMHRSGVGRDALKKAFQRLARAGYEIRIPVGTDTLGRPIYAMRGRATQYRIPVFPERDVPHHPRMGGTSSPLTERLGGTSSPLTDGMGGTGSPIGGTGSPLLSSDLNPSSSSADRSQATDSTSHGTKRRTSPEALIVAECGATPEEAAALVDHIRSQGEARRSLSGYVRHLVANGDMAERLRRLRAARAVPTSRHPADELRCGLHGTPMPGGTCSSCAGDIKCGDAADVVAYYQSLNPEERDTRADLKCLLESRGLIATEEVAA